MGVWQGSYYSDKIKFLSLTVSFENNENEKIITEEEEDRIILPSIFTEKFSWVGTFSSKKQCYYPYLTPRSIRAYFSANSWYNIPLPFRPNTSEFQEFFNSLKHNDRLIEIDYIGEKTNAKYLKL